MGKTHLLRNGVIMLILLALRLPVSAGGDRAAAPAPPAKAKCPVCGMFVAKYPDWLCSISFGDSATFYFDGPKDLFTFYLDPARYAPARKQADITAVRVKDYYSLTIMDGRRAFYVMGSDVLGPMGKELVPFAAKDDADGFMRDHRGAKVLRFGEINRFVMNNLK